MEEEEKHEGGVTLIGKVMSLEKKKSIKRKGKRNKREEKK